MGCSGFGEGRSNCPIAILHFPASYRISEHSLCHFYGDGMKAGSATNVSSLDDSKMVRKVLIGKTAAPFSLTSTLTRMRIPVAVSVSGDYRKDGIVNGRQRYECKQCQHHYTVSKRSAKSLLKHVNSPLICISRAWVFRAIGRILKVSNTAVLGWVKQAGSSIAVQSNDEPVEVVEVDEMHSYVGQKKVTVGFGLP